MSVNQAQPRKFSQIALQERGFLLLIGLGFMIVGFTYQHASIARWVGFALAGYSAIANDSIQTIGTFLAANKKQPWWLLWLFVAGLFIATMTYSFIVHNGDVTYERLSAKGFDQTPMKFAFLQVASPLFLLILTRLKIPVSTTFLLLTSFATTPSGIGKVVTKSMMGYALAFGLSIGLWLIFAPAIKRWLKKPEAKYWLILQWLTSGVLWTVWLMQDASNIAVFLPRQMKLVEFLAFTGTMALGLGLLMRLRGDRIQEVVTEKSQVVDLRAATLINFIYAGILFYFKMHSKMPMSTTWVFIGLLSGRELAMALRKTSDFSLSEALKIVIRDLVYVTFGLLVSVIIAFASNEVFADAVKGVFK